MRTTEVGRYEVVWRQKASRADGIFAGVQFTAPLDHETLWELTTDYSDIGELTPGVTAVRILEEGPTRQVIEIDLRVLWVTLVMTFELEQEPPNVVRFRVLNDILGEYRGVVRLEAREADPSESATSVAISTWLNPPRPFPLRMVMAAERMVLLRGVRNFLEECEQRAVKPPRAG